MRAFHPSDYPEIERFWTDRGFKAPHLSSLPRLGQVAVKGGSIVACGFCFLDACGSGVCWFAHFLTSTRHGLSGARGLSHVLKLIEEIVVDLDYGAIVASASNPSTVRFFEMKGYTSRDFEMTHLVKHI